jgi:hypothetical protein
VLDFLDHTFQGVACHTGVMQPCNCSRPGVTWCRVMLECDLQSIACRSVASMRNEGKLSKGHHARFVIECPPNLKSGRDAASAAASSRVSPWLGGHMANLHSKAAKADPHI